MKKEIILVNVFLLIENGVEGSLKVMPSGCQRSTGHQMDGTFMGPLTLHSSHNILQRQPQEPVTPNPT